MSQEKELFSTRFYSAAEGIANEIRDKVFDTPLRRLHWLEDDLQSGPIYAKLECHQKTGSFKYRGAHSVLSNLPLNSRIIAASAGNHALAIAQVAIELGIEDYEIVVPTSASPLKKNRLTELGASLVEVGDELDESIRFAKERAISHDMKFISSYDDPLVILGNTTIAREIHQSCPELRSVVVPLGGCGLVAGIGLYLKNTMNNVSVFGYEAEAAATYTETERSAAPVRLPIRKTLADGISFNIHPTDLAFGLAKGVVDDCALITEEEFAGSTSMLLHEESILVEPSGAGAVAALRKLHAERKVEYPAILILSGGNIDASVLMKCELYPYEDPVIMQRVRRVWPSVKELPSPKGVNYFQEKNRSLRSDIPSSKDIPLLAAELEKKSSRFRTELNDFRASVDLFGLSVDTRLIASLESDLLELSNSTRALKEVVCESVETLISSETKLRALISKFQYLRRALDWCSAAYRSSVTQSYFRSSAYDSTGVNYDRYEGKQVKEVEQYYGELLELDGNNQCLLATSSGMAAFQLAIQLSVTLTARPVILIHKDCYFETIQASELFGELHVFDTYAVDEIISIANELKADILILDIIANQPNQRILDISSILRELDSSSDRTRTVIIDGTMASCAFPASNYSCFANLQIFYFESVSKYLQFGLDIIMAGLVILPASLGLEGERLRRNAGLILYENVAWSLPLPEPGAFHERLAAIKFNACYCADRLLQNELVSSKFNIVSPYNGEHVDRAVVGSMRFAGGIVTLQFIDDGLNTRELQNALIDAVVRYCQLEKIAIVKGVSFGFSVPRISSAAALSETAPPFIRLYCGSFHQKNIGKIDSAFVYALSVIGGAGS